jgi:hypothetical protein
MEFPSENESELAAIGQPSLAGFLNLTPGPPPFSAMNSTPAGSRAARSEAGRSAAKPGPTLSGPGSR